MMWTLGPLSHPAGVDGAACVLCSWTGAEHGHSTSLLGHPLMFAALTAVRAGRAALGLLAAGRMTHAHR